MITRTPLTLTSEGVVSTGIGSWPGTELADALKIAFAECPDLPYL
ncbi:methionine synthase, partial [Corallococcus praedator]